MLWNLLWSRLAPILFLTSHLKTGEICKQYTFWRPFWKFAKFWIETTCFISETVSDSAKQSLFLTPVDLLTMKLQLLKISILGHMTLKVTWPQKSKLSIFSETVRDRAKQIKFYNSVGLLPTKLQLLKILILGSHDPLWSHDLANVNWPLSCLNTGWVAFGEVLVLNKYI